MVFHKMSAATWAAAAVFGASLLSTPTLAAGPSGSCRPVQVEQAAAESTEGGEIEQVGFRRNVYCPPCNPQPICPPGQSHEVIPPPPHDSATPMPTPATPGSTDPGSETPTAPDLTVPPAPGSDVDTDQAVDNFLNQPAVAQPSAQAPTTSLAQASSNPFASAGGQGFAPGMIGDYFGVGNSAGVGFGGGGGLLPSGYSNQILLPGGANAPQARTGVQKLAESTSPIPQDRIFFNYSYFNNSPIGNALDVQRFTFGFEKTLNDGATSVEVRLPFAATLDSSLDGGNLGLQNAELGDLTLYLKQVLAQTCTFTISGGIGVSIPTSEDVVVTDNATSPNTEFIVESESIHLYPFIGTMWIPNDRWFVQTFLQFDFDVNGNPISQFDIASDTTTSQARIQDRNELYLSTAIGYWLYRADNGCCSQESWIKGIIPQVELHYNQSITGADTAQNGDFILTAVDDIGLLNATVGVTTLVGESSALTLGFSAPLNNSDRQFDSEARVMFTKFLR